MELLSCTKKNEIAYMVFVRNLEAKNHLEDLSITLKHLEESAWIGKDLRCTQLTTQLHKTTANHSLHTHAEHHMQ